MTPLPGIPKPARDFAAELAWLKRLPPSALTDQKQDAWEADPDVRLWRAKENLREAKAEFDAGMAVLTDEYPSLGSQGPAGRDDGAPQW